MKKSIRHQLLLWLLIPLLSLAFFSTIASYFLGMTLARSIYDKQLSNSADSVIARIKAKDNKLTVDLPPAALAILRHNNQDEFYFQVVAPDGRIISGDKLLPPPAAVLVKSDENSEPSFRTILFKGNKEVRVVTLSVPTPDLFVDHVIVQAAETRNARTELAGQISISIFLAQVALIICGAIAVWIGVGRGLRPLKTIEQIVESRSPGDLSLFQTDEPVEVTSLIKALNRLLKQLDDDLQLQKRFTSNAAHQLRTPLAVVTTYCDLARKMEKDPDVQGVLAELESGISRMSKLVNRLLVLARSEPGVAALRNYANVDVSAIAASVTAAHVPQAIRNKIEFEFLSAGEPAIVYGDQAGLEELITNLVENSILYQHTGGKIVVKISVVNGAPILSVEDEGPGIPEDERGKVYERFYRIAGTEQPGTGLGLAIVKEIAIAHRATCEITNGTSGKGTCITIQFPSSFQ